LLRVLKLLLLAEPGSRFELDRPGKGEKVSLAEIPRLTGKEVILQGRTGREGSGPCAALHALQLQR